MRDRKRPPRGLSVVEVLQVSRDLTEIGGYGGGSTEGIGVLVLLEEDDLPAP
jgi:hypothetical protein